jgi:phosphate transport system substrate-binding protein
VGEGTAVNWPVGAGGKGNEGVAAFVGRLPNSMGYVEYSYVKQNKMTYAVMQNSAGNFIKPEDDSFKAAAAGADWAKSFLSDFDQPAWQGCLAHFRCYFRSDAYQAGQAANATEVLKFFSWAYVNGDKTAADLDYVPMPKPVIAAIEKAWGEIKDGSGKPVAFK